MDSVEKDVCVFAVIPGDFNTIYLVKNPEEPKEWGMKPEGWGRPGGTKKSGETEVEAVEREVREEAGFLVEVRSGTRHEKDKGNHIDVSYMCRIIGGKQKSRCQRFPLDVLPKKMYPFHRRMILLMTGKQEKKQR